MSAPCGGPIEEKRADGLLLSPCLERDPQPLQTDMNDDEGLKAGEDLLHGEDEYTETEYKRLRRKFGWVIIPLMCFIYGLAFACVQRSSAGFLGQLTFKR
jgi:hypothetical protein